MWTFVAFAGLKKEKTKSFELQQDDHDGTGSLVQGFVIFEKLIFAITSRVLTILTEHVKETGVNDRKKKWSKPILRFIAKKVKMIESVNDRKFE